MLAAPALVTSALLGLIVPGPLRGPALHTQRSRILLTAPDAGDVRLQEAAARVVLAAESFGGRHAEAAAAWVEEAFTAGGAAVDGSELLETQLSLFDECLIDDDDGGAKCKELDDALGDLEKHLMAAASTTPAASFFSIFEKSKLDRACARVRTAAAKFGPEQSKVADAWVASVRDKGAANPAGLLESQMALFGECLLDEDGGSSRCQELEESLSALQASLGIRGKVVSTRDLLPKPVEKD